MHRGLRTGGNGPFTEFPDWPLWRSWTADEWQMRLDCAQMENEFLRKRLQQSEERLESELASRNELEQKVRGEDSLGRQGHRNRAGSPLPLLGVDGTWKGGGGITCVACHLHWQHTWRSLGVWAIVPLFVTLLRSLACFLIELFVFWFSGIFWISSLSGMSFANVFFLSVVFHFLESVLCRVEMFSFNKIQLINSLFHGPCLWCYI